MVIEIFSGSSSGVSLNPDSKSITKNQATVTDDSASIETESAQRDKSGDVIDDGLRRGLRGRHFLMISLGSIIGPGCFWGLGFAIYSSGPLGSLICFGLLGEWQLHHQVSEDELVLI